jgi:bifunctional DNA-binding transcriptional regulator/antitoxin component of YhaV-PrlF toxin-antitoxin module
MVFCAQIVSSRCLHIRIMGMMRPVEETKISTGNMTTVPRPVRNLLDLQSGDTIEWHIENESIVVRKRGESK